MPQLRAEQLEAHLSKPLAPLYVIHGDEPLLALEAADAIRAAARTRGHAERQVFIAERGFDWSELGYAGASRSLFGGKRIIELRIPTGKPGTEGAAAIEAYCARLNSDDLTLVALPRLDKRDQAAAWFAALAGHGVLVNVLPVERGRLPEWVAARLARAGLRATPDALEFLAASVEGNLLAAHQEVQKLALLLPAGELGIDQARATVASVARYDSRASGEALLAGDLARYLRVIDGLRAEGEAPTYLLWVLADELRALERIQAGLAQSRPLESLLRENRVWGARQALVRSALRRFPGAALRAALARCAAIDRIIKGVGVGDPWDEFARLGLTLAHAREG